MNESEATSLFVLFSQTIPETFPLTACISHVWAWSITAGSPKLWPPLINSHSFVQALTNQRSRTVSSWLLIGLNMYERMSINQKRSHFWALCCKRSVMALLITYRKTGLRDAVLANGLSRLKTHKYKWNAMAHRYRVWHMAGCFGGRACRVSILEGGPSTDCFFHSYPSFLCRRS